MAYVRSPDDEAARHHLGMTSSRTTKIAQRSGATTRRPGRRGDWGSGGRRAAEAACYPCLGHAGAVHPLAIRDRPPSRSQRPRRWHGAEGRVVPTTRPAAGSRQQRRPTLPRNAPTREWPSPPGQRARASAAAAERRRRRSSAWRGTGSGGALLSPALDGPPPPLEDSEAERDHACEAERDEAARTAMWSATSS